VRLVFNRIRICFQVLDVRLEPAVFTLYFFELLRKRVILTPLGTVGHDSVRPEKGVISNQSCNHHGEDSRDAAALRICGRSNSEPSRKSARLRMWLRMCR
jgi:hypothetical protein